MRSDAFFAGLCPFLAQFAISSLLDLQNLLHALRLWQISQLVEEDVCSKISIRRQGYPSVLQWVNLHILIHDFAVHYDILEPHSPNRSKFLDNVFFAQSIEFAQRRFVGYFLHKLFGHSEYSPNYVSRR